MSPKINGSYRRYSNDELLALFGAGSRRSGLFALVALWSRRWRIRRQMARDLPSFNEAVLEDFGMSRQEALGEIDKPFWRA
ncbi:DUF1127 domain-containing protein [Rhizobium sp. L1K21]|uniref:DUF1127 domain-containing protein n=1 Tax=Rhizobium sp. L1K21 TaxID=2954933 RepID=UPI0020922B71|nr:hypothetical protein [Rhizobium sp. L1K21]MCO6185634.1 hypothetical protein [Rhizobium sp. L1K21]